MTCLGVMLILVAALPAVGSSGARACPTPHHTTTVAEWARGISDDSSVDVAAILTQQELLQPEVLALASVKQLHGLGIPLGVALQLERCFGSKQQPRQQQATSGGDGTTGWHTLRVTGAQPLVVTADTTTRLNASTAVVIVDGGVINVEANASLFILGSFSAPLQHVFVGEGSVFLRGDSAGRLYPQWWGAVADGSVDADRAIQKAVDAATVPRNFNGSGPLCRHCTAATGGISVRAQVFLPPGLYSISQPIELPDACVFTGAGPHLTHLLANASSNPAAIIAPVAFGANRTDGWRLSGFRLDGVGREGTGKASYGSGILLVQTSRAVISDISIWAPINNCKLFSVRLWRRHV